MTDHNNGPKINEATNSNTSLEFCKKLEIGGKKFLIVDKEDNIISGEVPQCCVFGSPEHVVVLKEKVDELKSRLGQLEQEHRLRTESVSKQLGEFEGELTKLGYDHPTIITFGTFGELEALEILEEDDDNFEHYKYDRLMRQPRIRQYWHNTTLYREAGERRVSFTELFWDLIFVVVIGNLGHDLVEDITFANVERFILTFYPIWRTWMDMTLYLNLYSADDLLEKFLLLFQMILVIAMGTHASDIFNHTKSIYLISYVIARMTFMLSHILHAICIPLFRVPFIKSAWGVFIPTVVWIIAVFVPADKVSIVLWIAIIFENFWHTFAVLYSRYGNRLFNRNNANAGGKNSTESTEPPSPDFSLPMSPTLTSTSLSPHKAMKTRGTEYEWKWKELFSVFKLSEYRPAVNIEHYSERLGLFTIIALGESVFGILYTSFNSIPDGQLAKAILGLLIAYNLHWIYFDVDASRQFQHALRRHVLTGVFFGFVHFPLIMALIAFGASLGKIVQLLDFPSADSIPTSDSGSPVAHDIYLALAEGSDSHGSMTEIPSSLTWLYCSSLAISLYCMSTIGLLHKGLDKDNYLRIPKLHRISLRFVTGTIYLLLPLSKVNSLNLIVITSMLSLLLVMVEVYGRLIRGEPLVGKCDGDILCPNSTKVKWRSGEKSWHSGILRRKKKAEKEVELDFE